MLDRFGPFQCSIVQQYFDAALTDSKVQYEHVYTCTAMVQLNIEFVTFKER